MLCLFFRDTVLRTGSVIELRFPYICMFVPSQWYLFWGLSFEVFRIRRVDCLSVLFRILRSLKNGWCSGLDAWIFCAFCSGLSPHRALKTWRCLELDPNFLFCFWTQCYYPHNLIVSVSSIRDFFTPLMLWGWFPKNSCHLLSPTVRTDVLIQMRFNIPLCIENTSNRKSID